MKIGTNWKIESDAMNITLFKRHITKKGKEVWNADHFFSSVKNALDFLVEQEIKGTGMKDFKTIASKQKELHDMINSCKQGCK